MKNYHLPVIALFLLVFVSCHKKPFGVRGKGNSVNETRAVSNFQKIKLSVDAELDFTMDSIYFLEIHAQQNIINEIETSVDGGELLIKTKTFFYKNDPVKITVHAPSVNNLSISGSGKIVCSDSLVNTNLKLEISGSGRIDAAKLRAATLDVQVSGSGDVNLSGGTVSSLTYSISGSGKIDSEYLLSGQAKVSVSGSGNVTLQVSQQLNVSVSGSGTVRYRGNPQVNSNISGSGKLIHI